MKYESMWCKVKDLERVGVRTTSFASKVSGGDLQKFVDTLMSKNYYFVGISTGDGLRGHPRLSRSL